MRLLILNPFSKENLYETGMIFIACAWAFVIAFAINGLDGYGSIAGYAKHLLTDSYFFYPNHPDWWMRVPKPGWMIGIGAYVAYEIAMNALMMFSAICGVGVRTWRRVKKPLAIILLLIMIIGWME